MEELMENSLVEWLSTYKKFIIGGALVLLAVLILAYRWISTQTLKDERDFFSAQIDFNRFQEKALKADEQGSFANSLNQLSTLMQRHPELQAKYDGPVAQTLIVVQQAEQARPFAERLFERTKDEPVHLFRQYADTSLLISAGQYQEALSQAQALKQVMDQQTNDLQADTLYIFNLIRLATLHQQLGQTQEEWQAWENLERYSKNLDALVTVYQLFREGDFSLNKYIEERKKILN